MISFAQDLSDFFYMCSIVMISIHQNAIKACKSEEMVLAFFLFSCIEHQDWWSQDPNSNRSVHWPLAERLRFQCAVSTFITVSDRQQAEREKFSAPADKIDSPRLNTYWTTRRWWFCVQTLMDSAGVIVDQCPSCTATIFSKPSCQLAWFPTMPSLRQENRIGHGSGGQTDAPQRSLSI